MKIPALKNHSIVSGLKGQYTKKGGILSYYEICSTQWEHQTSGQDSSCGTPYASNGQQWVAYDDVESVKEKVRTLVNRLGLNGVSFWALDFDDFRGEFCEQREPYPLINAALNAMDS